MNPTEPRNPSGDSAPGKPKVIEMKVHFHTVRSHRPHNATGTAMMLTIEGFGTARVEDFGTGDAVVSVALTPGYEYTFREVFDPDCYPDWFTGDGELILAKALGPGSALLSEVTLAHALVDLFKNC